jgi:hypothetical protein
LRLQLHAVFFVPPEAPAALDRREHSAHATVAWNAQRLQFGVRAGKLSAGADSHYQAPFGDAVEGRQTVRER